MKENDRRLKLGDLSEGDLVYVDNGFTCMGPGYRVVRRNDKGFYLLCGSGPHYLDGQEGRDGYLVGVERTPYGNDTKK